MRDTVLSMEIDASHICDAGSVEKRRIEFPFFLFIYFPFKTILGVEFPLCNEISLISSRDRSSRKLLWKATFQQHCNLRIRLPGKLIQSNERLCSLTRSTSWKGCSVFRPTFPAGSFASRGSLFFKASNSPRACLIRFLIVAASLVVRA